MELGNLIFGNSRGSFEVDREWQDTFYEFLENAGFDGYGNVSKEELKVHLKTVEKSDYGHMQIFDNGVFKLFPYYWGEDEKLENIPNFIIADMNYELSWYKYPLRDSYANKLLTYDEFKSALDKCLKSL